MICFEYMKVREELCQALLVYLRCVITHIDRMLETKRNLTWMLLVSDLRIVNQI